MPATKARVPRATSADVSTFIHLSFWLPVRAGSHEPLSAFLPEAWAESMLFLLVLAGQKQQSRLRALKCMPQPRHSGQMCQDFFRKWNAPDNPQRAPARMQQSRPQYQRDNDGAQ